MTRTIQYLAMAALLMLPCKAFAQSDSDDATASINVVATVGVTAVGNLDFGDTSPIGTVASSDVGARATWVVDLDAPRAVQLSLALPARLIGADPNNTVALTYGLTSARYNGTSDILFDPAAGVALDADVAFSVLLGEDFNGDMTGDVVADVNGAAVDSYSGVITLTVTVL